MFWPDKTIVSVQRSFFQIAHGCMGECLRAAEAYDAGPLRSAQYEPFGVAFAALSWYWASRGNVAARSKALIGMANAFPEDWVTHMRAFARTRGSAGKRAVAEAESKRDLVRDSFFQPFTIYDASFAQNDAWIGSHVARDETPTVPFRHTAQALSRRYFQPEHHPDRSSTWVSLGLPIV